MTSRRLLALVAPLALLLNQPAAATTAASLSDRIAIDGDLSDWALDEWVLDAGTPLPERADDSHWGTNDEIVRVGVTWDRRFLYIAVEFRATTSRLLAALAHGAGGLSSLDGAGPFRRAIDLPVAPNVLVLAGARDAPAVSRVDDRGVLVGMDRARAPAAVRAGPDGAAGFEAALPWSSLSLGQPLEWVVALTGDVGTGAGDAAPDPSVALANSPGPGSKVRVSLDRRVSIAADGDADGMADTGVSPLAVATIRADGDATVPRADRLVAALAVSPRVFAPDRGEEAAFTVGVGEAGATGEIFATARVYAADGRRVRVLYQDAQRAIAGTSLAPSAQDRWDGRDDGGRVVAGGVYVIAFEWGLVRGERGGRATAGVAVAR